MPPIKAIAALPAALSLLLGSPLAASEASTDVPAVAAHPALWEVADEDTTIYLFGTIHALPSGLDWYQGPIATALDSSDELVTEIVTDDETAMKMQQLVISKGMLPPDKALRSLLNDQQRATFDRFEPWYAAMMFSMLPLMKEGYSPEEGVEFKLGAMAGAAKPRAELETIEWQIGMFDALPQDTQITYMMDTIDSIDEIKPMLDKMVVEWLEGDADALAALMNESMTDADLAEVLLYSRNRTWAKWIDARLDSPGIIFVAVGAGHLAGDHSVQEALGELGIETTRVQ